MPKRRSLHVHPLDEILGSRANVAVLYRLRQIGVIDFVGAWRHGTSVPFRLRHEHPLALPIFGLFTREEGFERGRG